MSEKGWDLRIERTFDAPRARVWEAWTDADWMRRWYSAGEGWEVSLAESDASVGGSYRVEFHPPGEPGYFESGDFEEVVDGERLVYACHFGRLPHDTLHETRVRIELRESGGKTTLVLEQTGYPTQKDRDEQEQGWPFFLDSLARELAAAG